jgi:hypothetical protein
MVSGRKGGKSDVWPFLVHFLMLNSRQYHRLTSVFRNRFVVHGGTFSVAHETCRAAPAIVVIIILITDALLVTDASAVAMPEHIWPSTISLGDVPMC